MKKIDLTNQKYGRLLVLGQFSENKWKCQCDCGNIRNVSRNHLRDGHTKSCGCLASSLTSRKFLIDVSNKKFGLLSVVKRVGYDKNKHATWECLCDCGNRYITRSDWMRRGVVFHCGCLSNHNYGDEIFKKYSFVRSEKQINHVYLVYKNSAKHLNRNFSLSKNDVENLIQQNCYYCGREPSNLFGSGIEDGSLSRYSGIDRLDSSQGYILDNCVACCFQCNAAKSDYSKEEFISWIYSVSNHLKSKGEII